MGLAYPYILLLNLAFMIFWIIMKKREFIMSFLAILLGWNTLTRYISLHPGGIFRRTYFENLSREERHADRQLKVMSFNVGAFDIYRWAEDSSTRQGILDLFHREDPDILCLQEFYNTGWGPLRSEMIIRELERTPYYHLDYTSTHRQTRYDLAIFSRYPMVAKGSIEMNGSCNYADVRIDEDTVRIYNMHLQSIRLNSQRYRILDSPKFRYDDQQMDEILDISYRLKDAFVKRAGQADIISRHIEQSPYPVIVCGDFNDTPVSYTYHRLSKGLQDAFAESGWGMGRTYNGKFPSFRIDYILAGKEFEALHFRRKKARLSDHFPITAYLRIL